MSPETKKALTKALILTGCIVVGVTGGLLVHEYLAAPMLDKFKAKSA